MGNVMLKTLRQGMRTRFQICVLILTTALSPFEAAHAEAKNPVDSATRIQSTFAIVFQALQSGDVQTLKSHMAGHMYEQYKVLLEQNSEYPAFLRNFYRG